MVNLERSLAVTQNFVPEAHLVKVLDFLKNKPDQVSGFADGVADPYKLFVKGLSDSHAELLAKALKTMEKVKEGKKRKWDDLVMVNVSEMNRPEPGGGTFGFGFGLGEEEEIP